jgi:hypothetical protein
MSSCEIGGKKYAKISGKKYAIRTTNTHAHASAIIQA